VAGVMGGAETEVHDDTRNILLECAVFDARSIRATRRALGLSTDASYRFERGVDPLGIPESAARAASLIRAVAGGEVETDAPFATAGVPASPPLRLRLSRVAQVLGMRFGAEAVREYLKPLGYTVSADDEDSVTVAVPGHRRFDVSREDDLVEEIARRHGYDAFPEELRPFRPSSVPTHPLFLLEDRLRAVLVGRGLLEARTAAFAPASDGDVALLLPLAATESRLRRSLLPGLLRRVEYNFARGARSIRLFEIGTVFAPGAEGAVPLEATRLAIACTGRRRPPHWSEAAAAIDVWDLKGLAADVASALGLEVVPGGEAPLLDATLSFHLVAPHDQAAAGLAGRVRAGVVDAPAWGDDVWVLEVDLSARDGTPALLRIAELPQHPAVERDLALLVNAQQRSSGIEDVIRSAAGPLLEAAEPFDLYSGRGVPADMHSIAYRLRFRAGDRTLTDAEVDNLVRVVLGRLSDELGVHQRA
jgi:phenylalanyl-tRNA synthetase beta chain